MANVKFILQQPYKTAPAKVKGETKPEGETGLNGTKTSKQLNPYETRLYAFLIIDRDHIIKIKTEYSILPKEWDFKGHAKKDNVAGSIEFNKRLAELKADIHDKYKEITEQFPDMPFSQIARTMKDYGKTKEIPILKNDKDFFGYLTEYRSALEGEVTPRTIQKFVSIEKSIREFIKTKEGQKYESLTFSQIDHGFKSAYVNFLHNQPARGRMKRRPEGMQDGVLLATESKYIADLKTFLRWAEERKYNRYGTYKDFSVVTKASRKRQKSKKDIVTLTLPELRKFYSHKFKEDESHLARVRDLFCFAAFTLQRWSDIERFDKSQLEGTVWKFDAYKTKKETEIDLEGYFAPALDILKKYDFKLPQISLVKFNLYLKESARVAGITKQDRKIRYVGVREIPIIRPKCEFLTSHDARRTGISILLNDFNFPISNLMEITQHSDLKTLQVYLNPDRKARREAVGKTRRIDEILTNVKEKTA